MDRKIAIAAALIAACVVVVTGYFALYPLGNDDRYAACRQTAIAGGSTALGGPISLMREDGVQVSETDLFGPGLSLVYFGYTFCPDVCPLDSARTAGALTLLRDRGMSLPHYFVSIDPGRDTPEVLTEFTSYFDDEMVGLTGTEEEITAAAKAYRAYFARNGAPDDPDYLMDHSTFTYLVGADGNVIEIFRRDMSMEDLADSLACFIEAS